MATTVACPHVVYPDRPGMYPAGMDNCLFCKMEQEERVDPATPQAAKTAASGLANSSQKAKAYVDASEGKEGKGAKAAVQIAGDQLSASAKKANSGSATIRSHQTKTKVGRSWNQNIKPDYLRFPKTTKG